MKKNILKVTLVAAFALVAGYNVYTSQKSSDAMSDLAMANVEALASGEGSWTGRIFLQGEHNTSGCIHCPEEDSNCNC